jgi:hypothetical protein
MLLVVEKVPDLNLMLPTNGGNQNLSIKSSDSKNISSPALSKHANQDESFIYSTCTLNPFENEMQIAKLLEKYGDTLEILPIDVENKSPGIMVDYE